MVQQNPTQDAPQQLFNELRGMRDKLRLRAHLLRMDARQRWGELEGKLEGLEQNLASDGPSAAIDRAKEMSDALRALLKGQAAAVLETSVHEVMSSPVLTCAPKSSLREAAQSMWDHDCGVLVVVDFVGGPISVITDRDISMAAMFQDKPLREIDVESAMSKTLWSVSTNATLGDALHLMGRERIRRVVVKSDEGKPVGLLSLADIAKRMQGCRDEEAVADEVLRVLAAVGKQGSRAE